MRFQFRKDPAGIRESRTLHSYHFGGLLARIVLPILICQVPPRCVAAEAAPAPQPTATTTNLAAAADLAWKQLQKALRPPAPPEGWRTNEREAMKSGPAGSPAFLDEAQKGLFALQKEFPERPEVYDLMMQLLEIRSQEGEADQARALARALIESSIREEAKEGVRRM